MKTLRIAIVGTRTFIDYELFKITINNIVKDFEAFSFVSGGAQGADSLAQRYADEYKIPITVYKPDWSIGKQAGYIRNVKIWDNSDIGIAFWDGKSKGTAHSFEIAKKQNKQIYIINYEKEYK